MEIRSIQMEDIVGIRELLAKGTPYVLPHHHYIYWMMAKYFPKSNLAAIDDGEVIGYLCAIPEEKQSCYFIWQIIVAPRMNHKGVATELMNHLLEVTEKNDISALELTIDKNNKRSREFFGKYAERLGACLEETDEYRYEQNYDIVYRIKIKEDNAREMRKESEIF